MLLALDGPIEPAEVAVPAERGSYRWNGGVGPGRAIVAYTAICPHQWVHPEKDLAMFRYYRPEEESVVAGRRDQLIACCAHGSAFDPKRGGWIEQGPADLPLAAIRLEWEPSTDRIAATGVEGIHGFTQFFAAFPQKRREAVGEKTPAMLLSTYSKVVIRC